MVTSAPTPALVPELGVTDLARSLRFWCDLVGFEVRYARPEEGFASIALGRAVVMLDQLSVGRSWVTGELRPPLGRGLNLEIEADDLDATLARLRAADWPLFLDPEEKWYRVGDGEVGVRQFLVQDPDGYLLRLQREIGRRPAG